MLYFMIFKNLHIISTLDYIYPHNAEVTLWLPIVMNSATWAVQICTIFASGSIFKQFFPP